MLGVPQASSVWCCGVVIKWLHRAQESLAWLGTRTICWEGDGGDEAAHCYPFLQLVLARSPGLCSKHGSCWSRLLLGSGCTGACTGACGIGWERSVWVGGKWKQLSLAPPPAWLQTIWGSVVKLRGSLRWERYIPWRSKGNLPLAITELVFDVFLLLLDSCLQLPWLFLILQQAPGILEWVSEEVCPCFFLAAFAFPDPFSSP